VLQNEGKSIGDLFRLNEIENYGNKNANIITKMKKILK